MNNQKKNNQYYQQLISSIRSKIHHKLHHVSLADIFQMFSPSNPSYFQKIITEASKQINPLYLFKFLTIIHSTLQYYRYDNRLLEAFQFFNFPILKSIDQMQSWLKQSNLYYFKYLSKICLNKDLYRNILNNNLEIQQTILTIFLVVNQFNSFIFSSKQIINVAGRYYSTKLPEIEFFYDIIREDYRLMYQYLRGLVNKIIKNYGEYSLQELQSFLQCSNQIQKLNDVMEEIWKNKYYSKDGRIRFIELSSEAEYEIIVHLLQGVNEGKNNKILENSQRILKF